MTLRAGVSSRTLTPWTGVELTGWGYYLNRTWETIHDELRATALVLDSGQTSLAIISLDMMVISAELTERVRAGIEEHCGIPAAQTLVTCTHTHNAPAAGGLLGVGEVDADYELWASRQAVTAAVTAWRDRCRATVSTAVSACPGITFNRTRAGGAVDTTLTTLRVDRSDGRPLAVVVNFQAHPTVMTVLQPRAVSRDMPGEVCDLLEAALPGVTALYLQGACGDVNFLRDFQTSELCHEPARIVAGAVLASFGNLQPQPEPTLAALRRSVQVPTRRWTLEELEADRQEAEWRLREQDLSGWRESIGRVMTNRPDDMVRRHGGDEWAAVAAMCRFNLEWTDRMLLDYETRPEYEMLEIQSLRIGSLVIAANSTEFFSSLALSIRQRTPGRPLMLACYSNARNGYLPDAHDVERNTYAAWQSPKYCNQFPFTDSSGRVLASAMLNSIEVLREGAASA